MMMMMMMESGGMHARPLTADSDLEPHARSCPWPCPDGLSVGEGDTRRSAPSIKAERFHAPACQRRSSTPAEVTHPPAVAASACTPGPDGPRKAKSSRRNAWGNLSYAELITRAIESAPERRLTLSQIYDWMVRFVPYFKDKGDSNSSAGWKNSIRHNLSLHSRFIRVQNEGTGKSSWWMLNPEGGKMGKGPRRRAASTDSSTRYPKTKGRVSRKRAGAIVLGRGQGGGPQVQGSPEHGSPAGKGGACMGGEEFDTWTDLHSHTSSSASTLSGCLSPILAEVAVEEPEEGGLSCSTSPRLYPSPTSNRSPALGATGGHCPNVELPQLTDLTGAISLDESGYSPAPRIKCSSYPYVPGPKAEGSYSGSVYGQPSMGMLRHHTPMETIQENKPVTFQRPLRGYSENNALQSLLTGSASYCNKEGVLGQALLTQDANGVLSRHRHNQNCSHNHNQEHAHNPSLHTSRSSVLDQDTVHRQDHNQGRKPQDGLDYNQGHKPHPGHNYGQSRDHSHNNKVSSSQDHNPRANPMHNQTSQDPLNPVHSRPHHQALSPRVSTDILQPYSLKASAQYGPHPRLPVSPTLPANPASVIDVPQDPCRLAVASHPRHHPYPAAHHLGVADSWNSYYQNNNNNQPPGNSGYQEQPQNSHSRMAASLETEGGPNSLDCDVDSILLNDFMDTESMDFNFDGSLSQGVGMGMGLSLGAFACPPVAHSSQSWVPG